MTDKKQDKAKRDQKVEDLENQLKRALADYQNLQKRTEKEKAEMVKFANEVLLLRLLTVSEGLEMVLRQLQGVLRAEGFERVEAQVGARFDPRLMEAIDGTGDKVEQVLSAAYKLHDRIVRPARVCVRAESSKSEVQSSK